MRTSFSYRGFAAVLTALTVSACGGGGGTKSVPAASAPAPVASAAALGSARVSLTVPNHLTLTAARRRDPAYVSASTQSVLFEADPGTVLTKINLTGAICVPNAQSTAKICTFSVAAPIGGSITFKMMAFDQPFDVAGNLPGGYHTLSAASNFTAAVAEGQNTTLLPIVMGGIPANISVAYSDGSTTATVSGAVSKPLTITAYDASGAIIVAPGAFVDATGAATPIAFTSSISNAHVGYTVTPAATGVAGSLTGSVALSEPDDRVTFVSDAAGYVGAMDAFAHPSVPNHVGGAFTSPFKFGWITTPAFAPRMIVALNALQMTALGHQGVLLANTTSTVGFSGDVNGSCTIARSDSGGSITQIGGVAADAALSDAHLYLNVIDAGVSGSEAIDSLLMSTIASSNCTLTNQAVPGTALTPSGLGASNGKLYGSATSADILLSGNLPNPASVSSALMGSGTDFGTAAVSASPNGALAIVQYDAKKKVVLFVAGGTEVATQATSTMFDPSPYGLTVDTSSQIYTNNMTASTYGSAGGVDVYNSSLGLIGRMQLNAVALSSGPIGQIQNMTVGTYAGSAALFVACSDGIEVFSLPRTTTPAGPTATIAPVAQAFAVAANGDGRVWALLTDGRVEALLPQ